MTAGTGLSRVFTEKTRDSWDGKSNVPYFQTHSRDGTVPCFQRENTEQSGRDSVPYVQTDSLDGTLLSRIFNEKTRDGRDGTIKSFVF